VNVPVFLTLDSNDRRPLYKQVVDGVKALIARGELQEGAHLPSVRQVAGDLGVNLNTIAAAYRELQQEGLVSVRHGARAMVSCRRAPKMAESELRRPLRTALTQLVLAGRSGREIAAMVREELQLLDRKGVAR
jgi:DNA-binding transcriptional regulator YhcF (GntR family)